MRILFDARTIGPHYPGVGRYASGLLRALALGHSSEIRVLCHDGDGQAAPPGLSIIATSSRVRSAPDQWRTPAQLARALIGPGWVYHSPFYIYPYWTPRPAVVTVFDLTPLLHPVGFSSPAQSAYRWLHRLATRRARRLITLSAAARDDFVRLLGVPAGKITVVPPGHAPMPSPAGGEALPSTYLLCVGINKPHKNLPRLVLAYAQLPASAPPLLIVGPSDPRFPEAMALVERLGLGDRVQFLGRVSDAALARLYVHATLFICPSLAEGFGFPVLEAMAYGAPVMCSDLRVLRELAGEAAVYFAPLEISAITAALEQLLRNNALRRDLREQGQQRAAAFTWQRAADETWAVYQTALGSSPGEMC